MKGFWLTLALGMAMISVTESANAFQATLSCSLVFSTLALLCKD
jgi:hypothetical protein